MKNVEDVYSLSPLQESLLQHVLSAPGSGVGFEQKSYTLSGELDDEAFARAWQRIADRNPILRTAFFSEGLEKPLQVVYRRVELPVERLDWRGLTEDERAVRLAALLRADRASGFDPARAPLMRIVLARATESVWHLVWSYHHLLLDAWCRTLVLREFFLLYDAFRQGGELALPKSRPFRDYIGWLQAQDPAAAEVFWRHNLAGLEGPTPLGIERDPAPAGRERVYDERQSEIPAAAAEPLEAFARAHRVTLGTLVLGAWALLLGRYSGRRDVVFGVTVAGRPAGLPGVDSMLGMFINNLPMRVAIPPVATVAVWLADLQARAAELRRFEHVSPAQLQEWSGLPAGRRLFESLLLYQNTPTLGDVTEEMSARRLSVGSYRFRLETNYPLTISAAVGGALRLWIYYDAQRFDGGTIDRLPGHFGALLTGMAADPRRPLDDLPLLSEAERGQLLAEACGPPATPARRLDEVLEDWVRSAPDAPAIRNGGEVLTYADLWRLSTGLARRVARAAVTQAPGFACAVVLDDSPAATISLLAVLRAGGAVVALDPTEPVARTASRLDAAGVRLELVRGERTPLPGVTRLDPALDDEPEVGHVHLPEFPPQSPAMLVLPSAADAADDWSVLSQAVLTATLLGAAERLGVRAGDRIAVAAPAAGHPAALACLLPLAAGACLILSAAPPCEEAVDLVLEPLHPGHLTASFHGAALRALCHGELPGRGAVDACGGTSRLGGLAEAGLWVTGGAMPAAGPVLLGRPLAGARLALVDRELRLLPAGLSGELCVGGDDLLPDFPGRPALAAVRLVPDPFGRPGARMLRTGLLARRPPDGGLERLASLRHRPVVAGRPVDLGAVEAALRRHPGVVDWHLQICETPATGAELVLWAVSSGRSADLREELRGLLALYAPRSFSRVVALELPELPRAADGEIDAAALPDPGEIPAEGERGGQRAAIEGVLAGLWAGLLGVERVGVDENLFALGAHSLLATQLVSRVRQVFQVELPLRSLFEQPTVAGLAARIQKAIQAGTRADESPIVPVSRDGDLPLSYAQERLWFMHQVDPASFAYNIPRAVRIAGDLGFAALEGALLAVVARHESLRTTFPARAGCAVQAISPVPRLCLPVIDLSALPPAVGEREARRLAGEEARRPFDLAAGPLLRASLLALGERDHLALFVLHHVISDAWSMSVLVRELAILYEAFHAGRPSPLPPLSVQYADFAHWQRRWLAGGALETQLAYWTRKLSGAPDVLALATDSRRPAAQTFRGAFHPFALSPDLSRSLSRLGREEGVTLFMTLLAGFSLLLSRYSGQEDIVVGTDIANRNRLELEGMIGFFVNNLVLRTDLAGNPTFRELLRRVREVTLGAYAHQDLPFDQLVKALRPRRSLGQTPLFQVLFVLQNVPVPPLRFSGANLRPVELDFGMSKFDLALFMVERREGLAGSWHYSTDLFRPETIARATGHLVNLLERAAAQPEARLSEIEMVGREERELRERTGRERAESALGKLKSIRDRRAVSDRDERTAGADEFATGSPSP
jgi:non-ribosomal peptide synthetase component F/acyl carrier protein